MKQIDRFELINQIGRELQKRMGYSDIDIYLKGFGVDVKKQTSSVNSKWVYVKELLSDVDNNTIFDIADELEIKHPFARNVNLNDINFWKANHFKLFLSHLASYKHKIAMLQTALFKYGISSFVAHEDIEPTKEWLHEIERALLSMDALAAILTPGFKDSNWTDHEVGIAIGRNCLVIPIRKGMDPYGFIGKYQGFQGESKTVEEVARGIFFILASNKKTKYKMLESLLNLFVLSKDSTLALHYLRLFKSAKDIPNELVVRMHGFIMENKPLLEDSLLLNEMNDLFVIYGLDRLSMDSYFEAEIRDEDIPF